MKITQEEVVERQTVLHIELEEEDLDTYLDRGYKRAVQHAAIPGFRKGKAPRSIVERYMGRESLLNESLDFMLPDVTQRAIDAQDLETSGLPSVELLDLEPVTLKATVPLTPQVDLGAYRDVRVEDVVAEVTGDDVRQHLDEMLTKAASWEPVDRPVSAGDMVTMDVVGTVGDRKILEQKDAVYVVEEQEALPFPDFHQHIQAAKVGVPAEFDLTLSEDHPDATLAGQEAHFTVTVSEVKEQKLPELDDEFAKSVGNEYESLAELREAVERDLTTDAEDSQKTQYREAALDELLKAATVELPPLLVEHEVEHMVARRDRFVDSLKIRKDDYLTFTGKTEEQIREEMIEHATERLNRSHALATLADREGLSVSDEEIDQKIQSIVESDDEGVESLKEQDVNSDEVRSSVEESLFVGKAMDHLVAIARGEVPESSSQEESSDTGDEDQEKGGETVDTQA